MKINSNKKPKGIYFQDGIAQNAELLRLAHRYADLPEHEGIPALSVLRNFFVRKLREAVSEYDSCSQ